MVSPDLRSGADPSTGPYDALERLAAAKWDSSALTKARTFLGGSNLPGSYSTTLTNSGTNVYTLQSMSWQGTLLAGYTVTSAWDGSLGTLYSAFYDADAHLQEWSATSSGHGGAGDAAVQRVVHVQLGEPVHRQRHQQPRRELLAGLRLQRPGLEGAGDLGGAHAGRSSGRLLLLRPPRARLDYATQADD